jgi:hypothetical protein
MAACGDGVAKTDELEMAVTLAYFFVLRNRSKR